MTAYHSTMLPHRSNDLPIFARRECNIRQIFDDAESNDVYICVHEHSRRWKHLSMRMPVALIAVDVVSKCAWQSDICFWESNEIIRKTTIDFYIFYGYNKKKKYIQKKKYEMSFDHRIKSIKRWQQPWLDCSCLRKADNLILCCLVAALHCRAFIGRWHSLIRFVHVLIDGIAAPIDIIPITLLLLLAKCTMMMYEKYIEITTAATVIAVMLLLIMP